MSEPPLERRGGDRMRIRDDGLRRLLLLCGLGLAIATVQAIVIPFASLYATGLGARPLLVGVVVASGFLIPLLAAVRIGKIVDRFGVRAVVTAGAVLMVAAPVPVALAPSVVTVGLLSIVANFGHVAGIVASQRAVARTVRSRETAFGWFTTCVSVGQLIGPLAMGLAIEAIGLPGGVVATVVAAGLALTLVLLTRSRLPGPSPDAASGAPISVRSDLRDRPVVLIAIGGSGAVLFTMAAHQAFYPVVLDGLGVTAGTIGMILAVRAAAAIAVRPFLAAFIRLSGSRAAVYGAALAACGLGIAVPLLPAPIALAVTASFLLGVGSGVAQPLSMVLLVDHVPAERHGSLLGVRMAFNYGGMGLASVTVGTALTLLGPVAAFTLSGALPVALAIAVMRGRRDVDGPADASVSTSRSP